MQNCIKDDMDVNQAVKIMTSGMLDCESNEKLTKMINRTQTQGNDQKFDSCP